MNNSFYLCSTIINIKGDNIMRIEKKEFEKLMNNAKLTHERRVYDKLSDSYYTELAFIFEDKNNRVNICYSKGNKNNVFMKRVYSPNIGGINDMLMDDMLIESLMSLYLNRDEHITDILHWYAEDNFQLNMIPFTLFDIIDCRYGTYE